MKTTLAAALVLAITCTLSCKKEEKSAEASAAEVAEKAVAAEFEETMARCGDGGIYDPETQFCRNNTLLSKCGGKEYDLETQFCYDNKVQDHKCGNKGFAPKKQFCLDNLVYDKCEEKEYNPETQFCGDGRVFEKCGEHKDIVYNPATEYCYRDDVVEKFGFVTFEGQKYKTVEILSQIWMAENLNYNASGSICGDNNPNNCKKYGRLYDWATAMALPEKCNATYCSQHKQITDRHRGICPKGWHIPSREDWLKLAELSSNVVWTDQLYVFGSDARKLVATSGWNKIGEEDMNGTDDYGFSALPGGHSNSFNFSDAGEYGHWWSATHSTQGDSYGYAYDMTIRGGSYQIGTAGECCYGMIKVQLLSVRCVSDSLVCWNWNEGKSKKYDPKTHVCEGGEIQQ
jgi:uncharacterized protein (TIGR02145 family)